jgi:hypothetical protein
MSGKENGLDRPRPPGAGRQAEDGKYRTVPGVVEAAHAHRAEDRLDAQGFELLTALVSRGCLKDNSVACLDRIL